MSYDLLDPHQRTPEVIRDHHGSCSACPNYGPCHTAILLERIRELEAERGIDAEAMNGGNSDD